MSADDPMIGLQLTRSSLRAAFAAHRASFHAAQARYRAALQATPAAAPAAIAVSDREAEATPVVALPTGSPLADLRRDEQSLRKAISRIRAERARVASTGKRAAAAFESGPLKRLEQQRDRLVADGDDAAVAFVQLVESAEAEPSDTEQSVQSAALARLADKEAQWERTNAERAGATSARNDSIRRHHAYWRAQVDALRADVAQLEDTVRGRRSLFESQ